MPDGTAVTRNMAEDTHHFDYWQREALITQSKLLDSLPAGLRAPRSLGVTHVSRCETWLWWKYLPTDRDWFGCDCHLNEYSCFRIIQNISGLIQA